MEHILSYSGTRSVYSVAGALAAIWPPSTLRISVSRVMGALLHKQWHQLACGALAQRYHIQAVSPWDEALHCLSTTNLEDCRTSPSATIRGTRHRRCAGPLGIRVTNAKTDLHTHRRPGRRISPHHRRRRLRIYILEEAPACADGQQDNLSAQMTVLNHPTISK